MAGKVRAREVVVIMFGYGSNWAFWQVPLMWVGMIAFWGLVIWAVYGPLNNTARIADHVHHGDEARRVLDQRLAKGDIDAEEYRRVRDLIAEDSRTPVGSGGRR